MNVQVLRDGLRIESLKGGEVARVVLDNTLEPDGAERRIEAPGIAVMWSGWLASGESGGVGTWGPAGRRAFDQWCTHLKQTLAVSGGNVWVRPHARHVLSDTPSCADFLRRHASAQLKLLLDPSGMLTPAMLARADEHVERALSALAGNPGIGAVMLTNVVRGSETELAPAPIHRGLVDGSVLARMARAAVPEHVPLVLLDGELEDQMRLLNAR